MIVPTSFCCVKISYVEIKWARKQLAAPTNLWQKLYDGETETDCRENVSQSNQLLNIEFEIVTWAGNRMIHADTWVMWSKTCSRDWLTRYFLLCLGIYVDLNIFFLLSSALIQFLEVGYLFWLNNLIEMSGSRLEQFRMAYTMAMKERVETKPETNYMAHSWSLCWQIIDVYRKIIQISRVPHVKEDRTTLDHCETVVLVNPNVWLLFRSVVELAMRVYKMLNMHNSVPFSSQGINN